MPITVKNSSDAFNRQFRRASADGIKTAAIFFYNKCRLAVNKSNPNHHRAKFNARQRAKRGGQKTGKMYENMHNAYAGTPPFKRTGAGQSYIAWEFNGSVIQPCARVGVMKNGMYMIFLELGTSKIKARPWLKAMLRRYQPQLARLAMSGFKKG